jgi:hypothetical protein
MREQYPGAEVGRCDKIATCTSATSQTTFARSFSRIAIISRNLTRMATRSALVSTCYAFMHSPSYQYWQTTIARRSSVANALAYPASSCLMKCARASLVTTTRLGGFPIAHLSVDFGFFGGLDDDGEQLHDHLVRVADMDAILDTMGPTPTCTAPTHGPSCTMTLSSSWWTSIARGRPLLGGCRGGGRIRGLKGPTGGRAFTCLPDYPNIVSERDIPLSEKLDKAKRLREERAAAPRCCGG